MKSQRVVVYTALTLFCVITAFPFYWLLNTSTQPLENLFSYPPVFGLKGNLFANYYHYMAESKILLWLKNTFLVSLISVLISTFFAVPAAYSLSRFQFKGRTFLIFAVLFTQMLPLVLLVIPIYVSFSGMGLINTLNSLVILYSVITLPIGIWFLKGFFDGIPKELEESAVMDGCSRFNILIRIMLPLIVPGIVATATWSFIIAWDEYLFAYTLIDNESSYVISVGLASYVGQYSTKWNEIMMGAVLGTLPIIIIFMFFQKYLVGGLTAGSVKG